jgi:potassium efflux system protein
MTSVIRRSLSAIICAMLLIGAFCLVPGPGLAQDNAAAPAVRAKLDGIRVELDQLEATVERKDVPDATLQTVRRRVEELTLAIREAVDDAAPRAEVIRARLKELGPRPDDKAPPESADITREREERDKALQEIDNTIRIARALGVQAEQTLTSLSDRRRASFTRELFHRSTSLVAPALWIDVARNLPGDLRAFLGMVGDTVRRSHNGFGWWGVALIALVLASALVIRPLSQRLATRIAESYKTGKEATDLVKAIRALIIALISAAVPALVGFLIYQITAGFDVLPPRVEPVIVSMLGGFVFIAAMTGFAHALFAPNVPRVRLFLIPNDTADRLVRIVITTSILLAMSRIIETVNQAIAAALPLTVATRGGFAVITALYLMRELRGLKPYDDCDEAAFGRYVNTSEPLLGGVRVTLWAVLIAVTLGAVLGYVAFASFLVEQIAWAFILASGLRLLLKLVQGAVTAVNAPETRLHRMLQTTIGISASALMQMSVLAVGLAQLLLGGLALLLLLAPWGVESSDLLFSLRAALFGFTIGDVTISFATILVALALFAGGILLTRAIQRWLRSRYLPHTQLDAGLKNSITTGLGYIGFIAAAYFSIATLGVSLDRLAIVAGALSVGIGFGLQSIVNNFVSGLILLWERPIRVGDLVVVGEDQGYVRRINVRSTEIETFDRATIIVPNSNLVSGVVKNRVHTDRIGRVLVTIPMPRDTDPDVMAELMRDAALQHDEVLDDPAPRVFLRKVGEAMLEFDLVGFVSEVESVARISSDITFAIWRDIRARNMLPGPPPTLRLENIGPVAESLRDLLSRQADRPA